MLVALVGAGGLLVASLSSAPVASSVQVAECLRAGEECLRFPTVTGTNLLGEARTLPADFGAAYALVVVSFEEQQTVRAQGWLPLARQIADSRGDVRFYSVPVLGAVNPLVRTFIMGGMVTLIPDEALRGATVMLFLEDKQQFIDALRIPDLADLQTFLLDSQGQVLWHAAGDYAPAAGEDLQTLLAALR